MKKLIAILLVLALLPILPMAAHADESEGTYDGEYDTNGQRSGYGTWTFHNFLYVGNWENDKPNGEGTLYQSVVLRLGYEGNELYKTYAKGQWVDGYANGTVQYGNCYQKPDSAGSKIAIHAELLTDFGYPVTELIYSEMDLDLRTDRVQAGVPPFADVETDSSLPTPEFVYDDAWTFAKDASKAEEEELPLYESRRNEAKGNARGTDDGTGVYDGEYDAKGRRSGFGSWTYHNYLYVGNWKNDMPNGEGTLYSHEISYGSNMDLQFFYVRIVKGNWVDGYADGEIEWNTSSPQYTNSNHFNARNGRIVDDDRHYDGTIVAVPPWESGITNSALVAPTQDFASPPTLEESEAAVSMVFADGTYEGASDAAGKRSGYGTWAYNNHLYAGNWENGKPNGDGTLFARYAVTDGTTDNVLYYYSTILRCNWVDGFAEGPVEYFNIVDDRMSVYRLANVTDGVATADMFAPGLNARKFEQFSKGRFVGGVAPWSGFSESTVDVPWDLYELYPSGKVPYTPMERIENAGMGVSPGNLANNGGFHTFGSDMALLGDWIFYAIDDADVVTIYKVRTDGSQMLKIFEHNNKNKTGDGSFSTRFQTIGDWLYLGVPYKISAEDVKLTEVEGDYFWYQVVDDWEYEVEAIDEISSSIRKTKLDYSERIDMGSFVEDKRVGGARWWNEILFADEQWVYLYKSNDASLSVPASDYVSQITKVKSDGSGETESHLFREGLGDAYFACEMPQIVGGRLYYMEAYPASKVGYECSLHSIDLSFAEAPVTIVPRDADHYISQFHVTNDHIYYGTVTNADGRGDIVRMNHDGSNQTVLADGIEARDGRMLKILIAGDWMMFNFYPGSYPWYLMRLDGSDLHKAKERFVPSDAPGMVDSTGKWRYEVLLDGGARVLGAGSKLKMSGKLSIPSKVDKLPVVAIGENAFYGCDGFTSVTIPKDVTEIGDEAFFWCKGLTSATIPEGVAHIGSGAFQYCDKLKKLSLPASLTSVGDDPFANCDALKLSIAKKNETFEIVDGALSEKM